MNDLKGLHQNTKEFFSWDDLIDQAFELEGAQIDCALEKIEHNGVCTSVLELAEKKYQSQKEVLEVLCKEKGLSVPPFSSDDIISLAKSL